MPESLVLVLLALLAILWENLPVIQRPPQQQMKGKNNSLFSPQKTAFASTLIFLVLEQWMMQRNNKWMISFSSLICIENLTHWLANNVGTSMTLNLFFSIQVQVEPDSLAFLVEQSRILQQCWISWRSNVNDIFFGLFDHLFHVRFGVKTFGGDNLGRQFHLKILFLEVFALQGDPAVIELPPLPQFSQLMLKF